MDKSPDAFRTISEVAEWLGVQAHVLRFWESKFTQVKPVKRAGGRRYYRPADMELLGGIKKLLHDDGLTVKGVQKILGSEGVAHVSSLSQELCDVSRDAVEQMAPAVVQDADPIIVPFKSAAAQTEPELVEALAPEPASALVTVEASADPDPAAVESVASEPDPVPEPATESATEPEGAIDQIIAPPPDTPKPASLAPPVEDRPILPSFLHRPAPEPISEPAPEATPDAASEPLAEPAFASKRPEPAPEPEPKPQKSLVVDAPDPPAEDEIAYTKGPLAHLAGLDRLTSTEIAEIAPLARELQAWLSRSEGAGAP